MKQHLLIILILLLALTLRLIPFSPPSLYWEEVAIGYDAYSILKTGKDFHGNPWPLVAFESFGDYKPSLYFYATVPFVAILGLNEWAVRLPSIVAGTLTVWFLYLLVNSMAKDKKLAILSALMLAISPWHLQFSRAGFEVVLGTALLTGGIYGLSRGRKNKGYLFLGVLASVASMYSYHGLRLLAPILGTFVWIFWNRDFYRQKSSYVAFLLAVMLMLPILAAITKPEVAKRFGETSMFPVSAAVPVTNALREEDGNGWWARLVHHRYWYFGAEIGGKMASHFDPRFLFLDGDGNSRHQSGLFGLFYHWQILPLALGLIFISRKKFKHLFLIPVWIILATIPPALTTVSPHTLRFLPAAPALAILVALGLIRLRLPKLVLVLFLAFVAIDSGAYFYDYYAGYPIRSSRDWQYGYKQLVLFIKENTRPEQTVWVTRDQGRPSAYFMFYLQTEPQEIQSEAQVVAKDQGELLAFDRFSFGQGKPEDYDVMVTSTPQERGTLKQTIYFLDGKAAFYVYQNR